MESNLNYDMSQHSYIMNDPSLIDLINTYEDNTQLNTGMYVYNSNIHSQNQDNFMIDDSVLNFEELEPNVPAIQNKQDVVDLLYNMIILKKTNLYLQERIRLLENIAKTKRNPLKQLLSNEYINIITEKDNLLKEKLNISSNPNRVTYYPLIRGVTGKGAKKTKIATDKTETSIRSPSKKSVVHIPKRKIIK